MAEGSPGEGWWQASDGNWYPPEQHPDHQAAAPPPVPPPTPPTPPAAAPLAGGGPLGDGAPAVVGSGSANRKPIIVLAVLLVLGLIIAVVLVSGGDDDDASSGIADAPPTTVDGDETDATDATDAPEATLEPSPTTDGAAAPPTTEDEPTTPTTGALAGADDQCRYAGVDSFGDMQIELVIVWTAPTTGSASVTYALIDDDGVRFFSSTAYVEAPQRGERILLSDDTFEEPPSDVDVDDATCRVLQIEEGFGDPPAPVPDDAACTFAGVDFVDDVQVALMVSNPFDATSDLHVLVALRDRDGTRFASSSAFIDVVGPGEVVRDEVDTATGLPDGVSGDDVECEVLSVTQL